MNYDEFIAEFDLKLNNQQGKAVQSVEGNTMLLAVPGSGKTTVLVSRLGYMIYGCGIEPESILTMTYTVSATHDMRQRFISFFGDEYADRLEFRTINGVCQRIIAMYERYNGTRAFDVLSNEGDISRILSKIYQAVEEEFPSESDIKALRSYITYSKNMMLTDTEIDELDDNINILGIYKQYNQQLRASAMMDYDDQMVYAYRILTRYPEILKAVRDRYRYICVDEAQDTSKIQHEIIKLISSGNLFMVGDEDQSIYGFRAAYPEALLSFEKDHKNAKILLMEDNFRSDANIVNHADRFIQRNKYRHKKTMKPTRRAITAVKQLNSTSRLSQYGYLLKVALNPERETAILYRDNESMLPLVDLFERNGIEYRTRAADLTFFSHKVTSDIRDIIAFAYDPADSEIFMRIYYKLSSYLTKDNAQRACEISKQKRIDILSAAEYLPLHQGTRKSVKALSTHFQNMRAEKAGNAVYRIKNYMGYGDYLDRMNIRDNKLSILEAIGQKLSSPRELLTRLSELENILSERKNIESKVILSTIHSAKGLEYDTVYLIDVCDGIFPETVISNYRNADETDIKAYEDERRLFYVGATRAKNRLNIFSYSTAPSTFTEEFFDTEKQPETDKFTDFNIGTVINHRVFGRGMILSRDGELISVRFDNGTIKKLSLAILIDQGLI
ncbi:MAG: ATP-dependent helicase [Clostridia bacterium]|nr:ATP-dependent helicase [Clostridia bacterium]